LRRAAVLNLERTNALAERVCAIDGFSRAFPTPVFNEVAIRVPAALGAARLLAELERRTILGGVDLGRWYPGLDDCILMNATEMTTPEDIDALCTALRDIVSVATESPAVHV
jgi:glycine dehydrogenase subunit 1